MGSAFDMCTTTQYENPTSASAIHLPTYDSNYEETFQLFLKTYNELSKIPLIDYTLNLEILNYNSESKDYDSKFTDETDIESAAMSFNKTVINHPIYYGKRDEKIGEMFMNFIKDLLEIMGKGAKTFVKKFSIDYNAKCVKKFYLVVIGILFCLSNDEQKVQSFFDIISNEKSIIVKNTYTELFIFMMIFTAGYGLSDSCSDMQEQTEEDLKCIPKGGKDKYIKEVFSFEKMRNLTDKFMDGFFEGRDDIEIGYTDYLNKIKDSSFAWILTGPGIRSKF